MPTRTIRPNHYIHLRYDVPKDQLVRFTIEASHPVKSYVLRKGGLDLFVSGSRTFKYYGGYPDPRKYQDQQVVLPFTGSWYLIIVNPSKNDSAEVEYDVYY